MRYCFTSWSSCALIWALGIAPFSLGITGWTDQALAQAPAAAPAVRPAPAILTQTLAQIDAAASGGNLPAVMAFYDPQFTNSDGLTYRSFQDALSKFWKRYPGMVYKTEINSWKAEGSALVVETTTTITGTQTTPDRPINLTATIASRQRFEGQKIVQQEILSEQSQVTMGQTPPTVQVNLPEQITIGRSYAFDAIVTEPLGDRLLLGAALEETISAGGYLNAVPINLELLSSGGLFKIGRAPLLPENRWVSAVIIRNDGMTAVTQRMRIVGR
ncbi:MAG: nuclear transport factor 2 family protein [Timaviella obliquedivisa GSE-PSE-MK23-08B]|nr:nuclear transport factor 2 family protein [Timaviella obliquedivisa GSE-PSE-MK23-08B]